MSDRHDMSEVTLARLHVCPQGRISEAEAKCHLLGC